MKTLLVVCHPKPTSLIRAAAQRAEQGLHAAGHPVHIIDLDADNFDPVLTRFEVNDHLGSPEARPDLQQHFELLQWAEQLVLVYPTWFSGQPARLKGWFDRVWMHQVAFALPDGANRIQGRLQNIRRIQVVTSHGSNRKVNWIQGNGGKLRINRTLRVLCHRFCRTKWTAIYDIDNKSRYEIAAWLDHVETHFAKPS